MTGGADLVVTFSALRRPSTVVFEQGATPSRNLAVLERLLAAS
jgi:hypothetical protein